MDIVDTVKESTRDLPAQEDGVDRPAPLANVDATNVEDIYPLENIIPEKIGNIFVLVPFLLQKIHWKNCHLPNQNSLPNNCLF